MADALLSAPAPVIGAAPARSSSPSSLRRFARSWVLRQALWGRLSWPAAIRLANRIGGKA